MDSKGCADHVDVETIHDGITWQLWRLASVLLSGRSADGPAIVAADEDDRSAQRAGKVDSSVKVPFRGCSFSKIHCHTCLLAIQLCSTHTYVCFVGKQLIGLSLSQSLRSMHSKISAADGDTLSQKHETKQEAACSMLT